MSGLRLQAERLLQRRETLRLHCELQRAELVRGSHELQTFFHVMDLAGRAAQGVRRHPLLALTITAGVLAVVRPRRFAAALGTVMGAMRTWSVVAPVVQGIRARGPLPPH